MYYVWAQILLVRWHLRAFSIVAYRKLFQMSYFSPPFQALAGGGSEPQVPSKYGVFSSFI